MTILLINGSPRKNSTSGTILRMLCDRLPANTTTETIYAGSVCSPKGCHSAAVIAFPLYVDGLPSHLLACLQTPGISACLRGVPLYTIINCGFYEGSHAVVASEIIRNYSVRTGAIYRGALRVGGGGGIVASAADSGGFPIRSLSRAVNSLSDAIINGVGFDAETSPDYPRFIYRKGADIGWRIRALECGISPRRLSSAPVQNSGQELRQPRPLK